MSAAMPWVFDGHNDTILRVLRGQVSATDVAEGLPDGHIDAKRAQEGRFGGGFFAIFAPSPGNKADRYEEMVKPAYDVPLPPPLDEAEAADWVARGLRRVRCAGGGGRGDGLLLGMRRRSRRRCRGRAWPR